MRARAMSLMEVVMALGLLSLVLPLVINLVPSSLVALRRAEDTQAATAYAQRLVEEVRAHTPLNPGPVNVPERDLDGGVLEASYNLETVAPGLTDLLVTVKSGRETVILATRLVKVGP